MATSMLSPITIMLMQTVTIIIVQIVMGEIEEIVEEGHREEGVVAEVVGTLVMDHLEIIRHSLVPPRTV